jgi:CarD family transcriptional regulator
MAQAARFKVGDTVFYPAAGIGVIEGVEDVFLTDQRERCFVIRIQETQVTIKVPQANMAKNGIRPLVDARKIKELFRLMVRAGGRRTQAGNQVERRKQLMQKINSGSPLELTEVVRDLALSRKQAGGNLGFEDSRILETACNYLAREIAAVEKISPQDAYDRIRRHLGIDIKVVA